MLNRRLERNTIGKLKNIRLESTKKLVTIIKLQYQRPG